MSKLKNRNVSEIFEFIRLNSIMILTKKDGFFFSWVILKSRQGFF